MNILAVWLLFTLLKRFVHVFVYWQVAHDSYYLYVFAPDNDCRLKWVRALKEGKQLLQKVIRIVKSEKKKSVLGIEWIMILVCF